MKRPSFTLAGLVVLSCLLAACASQRVARINEHPAAFAALPPIDQEKIRQGLIDVGFQHEHVYMALGRPSKIVKNPEPNSHAETWYYNNFVFAPTSAAMVTPTQSGARFEGRQLAGASVRGGVVSTPRSGPTASIDDSGSATATLVIDLVEGRVVRIRLDP